jgi:hypothetical protein
MSMPIGDEDVPDSDELAREAQTGAERTCGYPDCTEQATVFCDRCERWFCAEHADHEAHEPAVP